jgi:predicted GNAT superfamily acetyltransferase
MPDSDTSFTVRDLRTFEEALEVHRIQRTIWGFDDPFIGLYPPLLLVASQNGGTVLGAFDSQGRMIGYLLGILGRAPGGPLKICSMSMGVLPDWRGRGVAKALKHAQRERALAAGLSLITWTFDPLEYRNAHLNLHTLGAISRRYIRNIYGEHFGALNEGLPTDRLLAEWWIAAYHETSEASGASETWPTSGSPASVFRVAQGHVVAIQTDLDAPQVWLEIPYDTQRLKQTDMPLALHWRLSVREAFENYFKRGYLATDFSVQHGEMPRCGYLLSRVNAT